MCIWNVINGLTVVLDIIQASMVEKPIAQLNTVEYEKAIRREGEMSWFRRFLIRTFTRRCYCDCKPKVWLKEKEVRDANGKFISYEVST